MDGDGPRDPTSGADRHRHSDAGRHSSRAASWRERDVAHPSEAPRGTHDSGGRPWSRMGEQLAYGFIPGSFGYGGEGRPPTGPAGQARWRDAPGEGARADAGVDSADRGAGMRSQRGRGPRGYVRSDARILEDVCERLTDDPIVDASDIGVACRDGHVILDGHVPLRWMKHRAEDIADDVSGVKDVENRVRVGPPTREDAGGRASTAAPARRGEAGRTESAGSGDASPAGAGRTAPLPPQPQQPH